MAKAINGHAVVSTYINAFSIDGWKDGTLCFFGTWVCEYAEEDLITVTFEGAETSKALAMIDEMSKGMNEDFISIKVQCGPGTIEIVTSHIMSDNLERTHTALKALLNEMKFQNYAMK